MEKRFQEYKAAIVAQEVRRLCKASHQFSGDVYEIFKTGDLTGNIQRLEFITHEMKELPFLLDAIMEKKERELGEQAKLIFEMGSIGGLLELCERIQRNAKTMSEAGTAKTIYRDQILQILFEEGIILHKRLAELLEVSPSNLSNIIKRLLESDCSLIDVQQVGKYKYYMLTPMGSQYVRSHLVKKPEAKNKESTKNEYSLTSVYQKQKMMCKKRSKSETVYPYYRAI